MNARVKITFSDINKVYEKDFIQFTSLVVLDQAVERWEQNIADLHPQQEYTIEQSTED